MPLYEYRCDQCGKRFEQHEPMSEHGRTGPSCPSCQSRNVRSLPGAAFVKTSRKS